MEPPKGARWLILWELAPAAKPFYPLGPLVINATQTIAACDQLAGSLATVTAEQATAVAAVQPLLTLAAGLDALTPPRALRFSLVLESGFRQSNNCLAPSGRSHQLCRSYRGRCG